MCPVSQNKLVIMGHFQKFGELENSENPHSTQVSVQQQSRHKQLDVYTYNSGPS